MFLLIPFMYFYFEEKDEDVTTRQVGTRAVYRKLLGSNHSHLVCDVQPQTDFLSENVQCFNVHNWFPDCCSGPASCWVCVYCRCQPTQGRTTLVKMPWIPFIHPFMPHPPIHLAYTHSQSIPHPPIHLVYPFMIHSPSTHPSIFGLIR